MNKEELKAKLMTPIRDIEHEEMLKAKELSVLQAQVLLRELLTSENPFDILGEYVNYNSVRIYLTHILIVGMGGKENVMNWFKKHKNKENTRSLQHCVFTKHIKYVSSHENFCKKY